MQGKATQNKRKFWYYILRGAIGFAVLFSIKSLTTMRLRASIVKGDMIPSQVFFGLALLGILLIYNSVVHTALFYDKEGFKKFKARGIERVSFFGELSFILKMKDFWLESLTAVILSAICSLLGGFYEAVFTVFALDGAPEWAFRLLPLLFIPAMFFLISLLCRYEIHRYFAELIRKGNESRIESKFRFALKIALILLMYPTLFPYSPYLVFIIFNFFTVVGALISLLSVLGFACTVLGLIFGIIGLLKLKTHRLRTSFIKKLREKAEEKGEELFICSKEEKDVRGYDFTLTSSGRTFTCRIITAINRTTPLYFTAQDAYFLHRLGTKEHHTSIEKHFEYSFPAEGQKLLLLIKFPKRVFASENGTVRGLNSGDRIWNYIIFDDLSFLGSFDRGCLYRSNEESG